MGREGEEGLGFGFGLCDVVVWCCAVWCLVWLGCVGLGAVVWCDVVWCLVGLGGEQHEVEVSAVVEASSLRGRPRCVFC